MVIIKGTVCYQDDGIKEYSDLEMMQMLGRAGRPQFDDSAVAVIITREEKKNRYEKLVSGQDVLESCLHLNLIEHLNAEIGLGTILDIHSAQKWLSGTFLATRLRKNPGHYKLRSNPSSEDLHATIEQICHRDISLLLEHDLIADERENGKLRCTDFGEAMSRYYVKFETMKVFLGLEPRAKISDIVSDLPFHQSLLFFVFLQSYCADTKSFRSSLMLKSITKSEFELPKRSFGERSTMPMESSTPSKSTLPSTPINVV